MLFDTGATKSIISASFVRKSHYLSSLTPKKVNTVSFKLGNGDYLYASHIIEFKISIQGHLFKLSALISDNLVGLDLILGNRTLRELGGILNLKESSFQIRPKKVYFRPVNDVLLYPGQTKSILLQGRVPSFLRNSEVVIESNHYLSQMCPSQILVNLRKGRTHVQVTNRGPHRKFIREDKPVACLNLGDVAKITQHMTSDMLRTNSGDSLHANLDNSYQNLRDYNLERYPHLDPDDPLAGMTEQEVFRRDIDLSDSILQSNEKCEFFDMLENNRNAFSLYGELSTCHGHEIDFQLENDEPFFIRPYFTTEAEKSVIEKELDKLVTLGILGVGHSSYTSPVLLVAKKGTNEKRVVTDFRYLNSRIKRINHPFPLLAETMKRIGNSNAHVLSVIDLKSAFFSLPLTKHAQQYTGISSFNGGKLYYYKRLAQGLNVSPGVFQGKIDEVLGQIPNARSFCIAHHDDIIVFSQDKVTHKKHLDGLFNALISNGLKISPKKCRFFCKKVIYMGHNITINDMGDATIQPLADRCTAIRNMVRPKSPKEARRFVGTVNYLSGFFPHVQSILKPLHQLSRKHKHFKWTEEHETTFIKIKDLMMNPPILHLPKDQGMFNIYSDTSRIATGSYITQTVNGKENLLGYYSKILPSACQRYSVTELELFGLYINISAFRHLLKGCSFNAFVDHSALVQICKSKNEPPTTRIQKLLLKMSNYSFQVGYKKDTEIVLADLLSRSPRDDDSEIDHVVPIAFSLDDGGGNVHDFANPIVTRSYAKKMGIDIPDLYPNRTSTSPSPTHVYTQNIHVDNANTDVDSHTQPAPGTQHFVPADRRHIDNTQFVRTLPVPQTTLRTRQPTFHLSEPRVVDRIRVPSDNYREVPPELYTPPKPLISNIENLVTRHVPKQIELDKLMKVIKRKIICDFTLPVDVNELRKEQEASPFFKPVYDYLMHDILPKDRKSAKSVQLKSEQYILCNGVLFRLFFCDKKGDFNLQLAVPENMAGIIISQFHDNLLSSHQGIVRTYLTIRRHFYMPQMFERINNYVKTCLRCQQFRDKPDKLRMYHTRVPDEYQPFSKISLDFKTMPSSVSGYKYLMVSCDEITRFVICAPLKSLDAMSICEAIIQKIVSIFGPPKCLITDAAASLTGKLLEVLCKALNIDQKVISVENHGSLQVERHIRTLSDFLKVNLNQFGNDWVRYVSTACYAYNSFTSPFLGNHSPYELVFGREAPNLTSLKFNPMSGLSLSYQDYVSHLKNKFQNISRIMLSLQRNQQEKQNVEISQKLSRNPIYTVGQLVYLFKPSSSSLTANSKRISAGWCGPLVVHKVLDRTHYILATPTGEVLHDVFNYNRLKPCFIRGSSDLKTITNVQNLKAALNESEPTCTAHDMQSDSLHFIDENDVVLPSVSAENIECLDKSHEIDCSLYLKYISDNQRLGFPFAISKDTLQRQLELILEAPTDSFMSIERARFKSGQLQILLSFQKSAYCKKQKEFRFWWSVDKYPDTDKLVSSILENSKIQKVGNPRRAFRDLYL